MSNEAPSNWSPADWRQRPIRQQPPYPDAAELENALDEVRALPPLVHRGEVNTLRGHLAKAARGEAFLLQGGDCAERFADCTKTAIEAKLKILLQMSLVLTWGARIPVIRVGRMAGQYAKPRSNENETINGEKLPIFRGDNVNAIAPDAIARMAERARRSQCHVIDAQITGGRPRALERQLRYMVGGDDEIVTRCRPVFETSAAEITHCGPVGMGSIAKICNNLVQFQAWMAYVEADLIAAKAGLAREKLFEVLAWIMNDNARTFLSVRAALVENPENQMLKERFTSAMQLAQKDLSLAQELAKEQEVPVPGTDLARGHMAHLLGVDPQESA